MYWIYIKGFVCSQNIFSYNPKGMAYLGFYQQNHLVRMPDTNWVFLFLDFIDIPTKYPHAKTCYLMSPEPREPADQIRVEGRSPRPKDAATLILIDRSSAVPLILAGRRKMSLKFLPGLYVFPGGKLDRHDRYMPHLGDLSTTTLAKLTLRTPRPTPQRLRALALAAIRETYEEAGVLLGQRQAPPLHRAAWQASASWQDFATHQVTPDLSTLHYIARAITPPNRPRRYDTRFFIADRRSIAVELPEHLRPDTDLEDVEWLSLKDLRAKPLPFITTQILNEIEPHLKTTDWGSEPMSTPFYYQKQKIYCCDYI